MDRNQIQALQAQNYRLRERVSHREQHLNALGQTPTDAQIKKDFYIYVEDFTTENNKATPSGQTNTGNINIQSDSDFVMQKLTYFADIDAAAQTDSTRVIPLMTVQIKDTGSGRDLIETPTPISNIFGSGRLPFILPTPKLFLARSTIAITVTNFDAAETYNVRLAFIGYKVFRMTG